MKFARTSEKRPAQSESLFDEAEFTSGYQVPKNIENISSTRVKSHSRKRGGRKPFPKEIPREDFIHDLTDAEKVCACGCQMEKCGEEVKEKLDIIPAKLIVERHIRPKYTCKKCLNSGEIKNAFRMAENPPEILPKSIATAGLFAHVLTNKFCDHLPYYRQENIFQRHGMDISRGNMSNWQIQFYEQYDRLVRYFWEDIFQSQVLLADETPIQVMKEAGRKDTQLSYMFAFAGQYLDRQIRIFYYRPTRSANFLSEYLQDFSGILHTDGFKSYDALCTKFNIPHAGCWAHARREFVKHQQHAKHDGKFSDSILHLIQKLYRFESQWRERKTSLADLKSLREKHSRPITDEIFQLIEKKQSGIPPGSDLGKAIAYAINQKEKLLLFLQYPQLNLDTNIVENAIRPFVVGRKNWLFSGSPRGADSSALIYSLIETAKANNIDPYFYLRYLFEKLPRCQTDDEIRNLLPHRIDPSVLG